MKLIRPFLTLIVGCFLYSASAQNNLTSNNKSLAIFNPALQNYQYNKLSFSNSVYLSPFVASNDFINYTSNAELNFKDRLRVGVYASKSETRLNRFDTYKVYGSYGFQFENDAVFAIGLELGYFEDIAKIGEFNRVWAPNHFTYTDSVSSGIDIGAGVSFRSGGWTVGFSLSKLNRPNFVPFPDPVLRADTPAPGQILIYDTAVVYGDDYLLPYSFESNINLLYEWYVTEKIELMHALHVSNIDLGGLDYFGFQTIMKYNEKLSVGLGYMYNDAPVYMLNAGVTLFDKVSIEASSFFVQDLEFESDGDNLFEETDGYVNQGVKPMFEFNLRIDL